MRRLLSALGIAALSSAIVVSAQPVTAIVGARLIDGTGSSPIADSAVIVEGDRITAAGMAADLVLLERDPTAAINNTTSINRVMRAGRWVK